MPIIPATWEAEAGDLLEPGKQRLWWIEIAPLHSRLGNKNETSSQKKKKSQYNFYLRIANKREWLSFLGKVIFLLFLLIITVSKHKNQSSKPTEGIKYIVTSLKYKYFLIIYKTSSYWKMTYV